MIRPKIALSQDTYKQLKKQAFLAEKPLQIYLSELIIKGYQQEELAC